MESAFGIGSLDNKLFETAQKSFKIADHLAYVVFPLLKDTKLIKQILEEICIATVNLVNAILFFEHKHHGLRLTQDKKTNLEIFKKISYKIGISEEETRALLESLGLSEMHKKSSFETIRNNNILLVSNQKSETITLENLKKYINTLKFIIQKFESYTKDIKTS